MEILALDLWDKRVGIARARESIAFPLDIVARTSIISYLKKYKVRYWLDSIIIWLPYDLYGKQEKQLRKTQSFIQKLHATFPDIELVWHDERFSTFLAESDEYGRKDAHAAQLILESYLQKTQNL